MYPTTKIEVEEPSQLEQLATKAKYWFWDEENKQQLALKMLETDRNRLINL